MSKIKIKNESVDAGNTAVVNLEHRLQLMHHSWRKTLLFRGVAQSFGVLIAVVVTACLMDLCFNFSFPIRFFLMCVVYLLVSLFTWTMWLKDYIQPFSLERMAWLLEKSFPELNEKLISSVEFSKTSTDHISLQLIAQVLALLIKKDFLR